VSLAQALANLHEGSHNLELAETVQNRVAMDQLFLNTDDGCLPKVPYESVVGILESATPDQQKQFTELLTHIQKVEVQAKMMKTLMFKLMADVGSQHDYNKLLGQKSACLRDSLGSTEGVTAVNEVSDLKLTAKFDDLNAFLKLGPPPGFEIEGQEKDAVHVGAPLRTVQVPPPGLAIEGPEKDAVRVSAPVRAVMRPPPGLAIEGPERDAVHVGAPVQTVQGPPPGLAMECPEKHAARANVPLRAVMKPPPGLAIEGPEKDASPQECPSWQQSALCLPDPTGADLKHGFRAKPVPTMQQAFALGQLAAAWQPETMALMGTNQGVLMDCKTSLSCDPGSFVAAPQARVPLQCSGLDLSDRIFAGLEKAAAAWEREQAAEAGPRSEASAPMLGLPRPHQPGLISRGQQNKDKSPALKQLVVKEKPLRALSPGVTTLTIRNVPARYTQDELMKEWGPKYSYNFFHLPYNTKEKKTLGFAFVNFTTHGAALFFQNRWHGKFLPLHAKGRALDIVASPAQGYLANLQRVRITNVEDDRLLPATFNGNLRLDTRMEVHKAFLVQGRSR